MSTRFALSGWIRRTLSVLSCVGSQISDGFEGLLSLRFGLAGGDCSLAVVNCLVVAYGLT